MCCTDHLHCCPHGTTCDLEQEGCISGKKNIAWSTKLPAGTMPPRLSNIDVVKCSDGSECPDGATCCKMASGQFGCCPMPQVDIFSRSP